MATGAAAAVAAGILLLVERQQRGPVRGRRRPPGLATLTEVTGCCALVPTAARRPGRPWCPCRSPPGRGVVDGLRGGGGGRRLGGYHRSMPWPAPRSVTALTAGGPARGGHGGGHRPGLGRGAVAGGRRPAGGPLRRRATGVGHHAMVLAMASPIESRRPRSRTMWSDGTVAIGGHGGHPRRRRRHGRRSCAAAPSDADAGRRDPASSPTAGCWASSTTSGTPRRRAGHQGLPARPSWWSAWPTTWPRPGHPARVARRRRETPPAGRRRPPSRRPSTTRPPAGHHGRRVDPGVPGPQGRTRPAPPPASSGRATCILRSTADRSARWPSCAPGCTCWPPGTRSSSASSATGYRTDRRTWACRRRHSMPRRGHERSRRRPATRSRACSATCSR